MKQESLNGLTFALDMIMRRKAQNGGYGKSNRAHRFELFYVDISDISLFEKYFRTTLISFQLRSSGADRGAAVPLQRNQSVYVHRNARPYCVLRLATLPVQSLFLL